MRLQVEARLVYHMPHTADVLLAVEGAQMTEQRLVKDLLTVSSAEPLRNVPGDDGIGRRTWASARGDFMVEYHGTFDVERGATSLAQLAISPRPDLPAHVIPYLWPSRFCQSDRFISFVTREFEDFEGGAKIDAMAKWIGRNIDYRLGASHGTTSAVDSFLAREGVCRDFSHVMAAFARAGLPLVLSPKVTWGLEAGVGGAWFFLGGLGVTAEVVGDLFYGAGTRESAVTTYPVLSGQLGLLGTYEVLP